MAKINRTIFFNLVRTNPFGGKLTQQNVDGTEAILTAWEGSRYADQPLDGLAYILATAFGETGTMKWDVRENPPKGRTRAEYFEERYGVNGSRPHIAKALGNTLPGDGGKYYGRSWPQITGKRNYQVLQDLTGVPFVANPDLALERPNSAAILLHGMYQGLFTGRKLGDYFDGRPMSAEEAKRRRIAARAIINGKDKAETFARIAAGFSMALVAACASKAALFDVQDLGRVVGNVVGGLDTTGDDIGRTRPGLPSPLEDLAPAVINAAIKEATGGKVSLPVDKGGGLLRSTIVQGSVLAGLPGILGAVTSIQDRYVALAVVGAIVVGMFLVITGRVKIQNEAGV
jgi:putative chitinase